MRALKREFVLNAATATQVGLVALLPFLPFLAQWQDGSLTLASRAALFIAGGCVLVALLARWVYFAFALAFVPLSVLSIHLVRRFGGGQPGWRLDQPDARVEAFFESPTGEIREYFQAQWGTSDSLMLAAGAVYLVLLAWVLKRAAPLTAVTRGAFALMLAAWIAVAAFAGIGSRLAEWPQYQLAYAGIEARARTARFAERDEAIKQQVLPFADCTRRYRKVVIVIGESVALGHLGVFGYERPTTPFAAKSQPELFAALAAANQTRISLALMLTTATAGQFEDFYRTPSLVSRLAACGYRTRWVSNQGRVGRYDSAVTSIAHEAEEVEFLNALSYKSARYDSEIVEALAAGDDFAATRQATFIHLIGSHADYTRRYPTGFAPFLVRGVVDAYDNSIRYTDSILEELYRRFGAEGTLFIYVADHGEVVSDRVFGHGFSPGYREEYLVPLMIWTGDHEAIGAIRRALGGQRLNLESFDDVVSFLVGSTDRLRVSTSTEVSNLSAGNRVPFAGLRSIAGPHPSERSKPDE